MLTERPTRVLTTEGPCWKCGDEEMLVAIRDQHAQPHLACGDCCTQGGYLG